MIAGNDAKAPARDPELTYPEPRGCPFSPPPAYTRVRDGEGIGRIRLPDGGTAWLVTRHEDVRAVLTDPRFSADRRDPGFPSLTVSRPQLADAEMPMLFLDGAEHNATRREYIGEFTVRRMRALEPRIHQIVNDRIDVLLAADRPADLVSTLALPVPSLVICELLGVPYSDHEFFETRTRTMVRRHDDLDAAEADRIRFEAATGLRGYLEELVDTRIANPTEDDLVGRQVLRKRAEGGGVHRDRLAANTFLLLVAGHETTANMIALGTAGLLSDPGRFAAWKRPEGTEDMVEELLRYYSIVENGATRVAVADVELGGVTIRAGDGVLGLTNVANRDPGVFTDPDTLQVDRGDRHHMSFGFGPHQCLGQNLARAELRIVFDTLFTRVPGLRLAVPVADLDFKHDAIIHGVNSLPVTW